MKEKLPYDFKQHHAAQGDVAMLTVQSVCIEFTLAHLLYYLWNAVLISIEQRVDTLLIDLILNYNEGIPGRQAMSVSIILIYIFCNQSLTGTQSS